MTDQILGLQISWIQWTISFIVPAGVVLLLAPLIIYKIYKPTIGKIDNKRIAAEGLKDLGPISRNEKILLVLFLLAIILWSTSSYTKINSTAVVLAFIASHRCPQVEGHRGERSDLVDPHLVRRHSRDGGRPQ